MDEQKLNKKLAEQAGFYGTPEQCAEMEAEMLAEKNRKLAEWVGFRHMPYKEEHEIASIKDESSHRRIGSGWGWVHPNWVYGNGKWSLELPNFTQSLDACFEWLVPKLGWCSVEHIVAVDPMGFPKKDYELPYTEPKRDYYVSDAPRYHWYRATLWAEDGNNKLVGDAGTPALALCLAIEKLIDGEATNAPSGQ